MKKILMILMALILILIMVPAMAEAPPVELTQGIDLTPVFQAVIAFLAALVTYKLVPWIKARTTAAQQEKLRGFVKVFVFAAEQLYGAGKGKEKLMYVKGKLAEKGFHVDIDEIEAKVQEINLNQQAGKPMEIVQTE